MKKLLFIALCLIFSNSHADSVLADCVSKTKDKDVLSFCITFSGINRKKIQYFLTLTLVKIYSS